MRNNIKLAVSYIRYYKKQAFILFLGICMSVLLMDGIASLIYSNYNADYENAKAEYGSWNYAIPIPENLTDKEDIICSDDDYRVKSIGIYSSYSYEDDSRDITFCYGDGQYRKMTGRELLEGKYPEKPGEVALDYYALHNLGMDYTLGSTLKLAGETYTMVGILSEGAKTDDHSIWVFIDENSVADLDGSSFYYLEFSEESRAYEQLSAFLQTNHIRLSDFDMNDGVSAYAGAEPKESLVGIVWTAFHLEKGKLIYLLGTLNSSMNLLQKMVFAILYVFGIFIIYSIFQVIVEKRMGQYGMLEVLGMEEKSVFASLLIELCILFIPACFIGCIMGNVLARQLYAGTFQADIRAALWGFVLFLVFIVIAVKKTVHNMQKMTQREKMKNSFGVKSRRIVCLKKHNLMGTLSRRFILAKRSAFTGIILSLSLGGVLFVCTTYVADNAKQNNVHSMLTDDALYTDIRVAIQEDDLGKVIPKDIVNDIRESGVEGIKEVFPVSYTLGEIPLSNGIFKWKDFYPEVAEHPSEKPNKEIMEKYNGIATKQGESDYKLKVNVYGYETKQLSDLSEYLLEGSIEPDKMKKGNQVVLKTLMDGAGYYNGIDIWPGDSITLKVPKNISGGDRELLKFQSSEDNYVEKEFTVCAIVSRCVGETDEFIGAGTDVVSVIMPQEMMESDFEITDYNSVNINLKEDGDSQDVINEIRPYVKGLSKCVIHDNTINIDKKNAILMQKVYFFYGIAIMLFFISLLHTVNSMKHQIQSRRYELGIVRAMGITEQGFRNMLMKEGLFYGVMTSISMVILTVISKTVLAGVMQHVVRYIIVNNNIPMFPCLMMAMVNIIVCVLAMLLSGSELLHKDIAKEIRE